MAKVTIEGVPGFDGDYPLDFEERPLTNWEFHLIKKVAGVRAGELQEAAEAGDLDLMVAFAAIALVREGKVEKRRAFEVAELLMDADAGKIIYGDSEEDADEGTAGSGARPPAPKPNDEDGGASANTPPSSPALRSIGDDPPETGLQATGSAG